MKTDHQYPPTVKREHNEPEVPLPEEHFRKLGIASRPTFFRWEKLGLRVLRVGGRRFIYLSDLREFMEAQNANCETEVKNAPAEQR